MNRKILAAVLSAAMTLSLAGCQGGNSATASPASGTTSTGAAASGDTIKIGVVTPLTGQTSTFGQSAQKGLQLLEKKRMRQAASLAKRSSSSFRTMKARRLRPLPSARS